MDLMLLIGIATALFILLISLYFLRDKKPKDAEAERPQAQQRGAPVRIEAGIPRRAQIARNQRNRLRQNAAAQNQNVNDDVVNDAAEGSDEEIPAGAVLDEKMGAKKRAKLEAKEQKRQMREYEMQQREERKTKEAKEEEERKRHDAQVADEERKQAEAERLAREERERKELEEYMKIKEAFSVEEEGYGEADDAEKEQLLSDFIQYVKNNKVVVLEDLAAEFKLKTQNVIDRIQELQANGTLTGVIDDRGKFIYISEKELIAVSKFIKQRGRVSIAELAENSNSLINLTPVETSLG